MEPQPQINHNSTPDAWDQNEDIEGGKVDLMMETGYKTKLQIWDCTQQLSSPFTPLHSFSVCRYGWADGRN